MLLTVNFATSFLISGRAIAMFAIQLGRGVGLALVLVGFVLIDSSITQNQNLNCDRKTTLEKNQKV